MFGYYRFFLAVFVLMSHLDFSLQGFNIGVPSVVSFYMLAGYVVCNLLTNVFVPDKTVYVRFYCERILRIYPQDLFIVLLTIAITLGIFNRVDIPHSIQVIVGILISMPVISYLSSFDKKIIFNRFMGNLSYGIFLYALSFYLDNQIHI